MTCVRYAAEGIAWAMAHANPLAVVAAFVLGMVTEQLYRRYRQDHV